MFTHRRSELGTWSRTVTGILAAFVLLIITSSCEGASSFHWADLAQPVGLGVDPGRFPGPGKFPIDITVINGILTGSITCDNDVFISPAGPPQVLPDRQITPMLIDIPLSVPVGTVTCFAPTSGGKRPFTIGVGPPPPPTGPPPCVNMQLDYQVYELREPVIITFTNNCPNPVRLSSTAPWFIHDRSGQVIYTPLALFVITVVDPGQQLQWTWDQKGTNGKQIPVGTYYLKFFHTLENDAYFVEDFDIVSELTEQMLIKRFDVDWDDLVDDAEFLVILDAWIAGELDDTTFLKAVDLWIAQQPISSAEEGAKVVVFR